MEHHWTLNKGKISYVIASPQMNCVVRYKLNYCYLCFRLTPVNIDYHCDSPDITGKASAPVGIPYIISDFITL